MLGIDSQRAKRREAEPGADPGVFGSQRGDRICSEGAAGCLRGVTRSGPSDVPNSGRFCGRDWSSS